MSVYTDLVASVVTIDAVPPAVGFQRAVAKDLEAARSRLSIDYPSGYTARDEVVSIAENALIDGGDFAITVVMPNGETFETAGIAFNGNAAAIQSAIDTAGDGVVTGYMAGDIVASGGPINAAAVVLTFSGDSVASKNVAVTVTDEALTDGGVGVATPVVTVTTDGQSARTALAALTVLGVISGLPVQGTSTGITAGSTPATNPYYPTQELIRRLANEAAITEGVSTLEAAILTAARLSLNGR